MKQQFTVQYAPTSDAAVWQVVQVLTSSVKAVDFAADAARKARGTDKRGFFRAVRVSTRAVMKQFEI